MPIQTENSLGHTPGPWHGKEAPSANSMRSIRSHDGKAIAFVNRGPRATANECLLAAAPELLVRLKELRAMFGAAESAEYGSDELLMTVDIVIAKAEGREP